MATIQSTTGLASGIQIGDLVTKLMALAAKPRDLLKERTTTLKSEQTVLTELTALLVSTQYITDNLGKSETFATRNITSSNSSVLTATATGQPSLGGYQFTAVRTAQSQQLLSGAFGSSTQPIGAGSFAVRFGDTVGRAMPLEILNGGSGLARGKIRITDRSGAVADINLATAQSLEDVLQAINNNQQISVTAVAQGDHIRLIDATGSTASNLKVAEVGGGTTAASLGLAGINSASDTADGQDIVRLTESTRLDLLNDGMGVSADPTVEDVSFQLRDGTTGTIDFSQIASGGSTVLKEITVDDILATINAAAPGKLKAEIAADGTRLEVTDLTSGSGSFQLTSLYGSGALADLGLDGVAIDGVLTGRRLLGGLRSVLLSSLGGGSGLGTLGALQLTDRAGNSATVDLSAAETLDDVITAIAAAGLGITARVNRAGNGIELVDTTGATAHNLTIASGDGAQTAEKLGIAVDSAVTSKNSGDLHLQVVGANTLLSKYNGGAGVAAGTINITDTLGRKVAIDLRQSNITTIGDVIREINRSSLAVHAALNDTGDGIVLQDTGHGTGALSVTEGTSTTAKDLHLLTAAKTVSIGGVDTQVIDGSTTRQITLDSQTTLASLVTQINEMGAGFTASALNDGSSGYRLLLVSQQSGSGGQMVVDTSGVDFSFNEMVRGQDALLAFGDAQSGAAVTLVASSTNTFSEVVSGAAITIQQASANPVTLNVTNSDTSVVASVKTFVDNYNKFQKRLSELTAYDTTANTSSLLTGSAVALRLDSDLTWALSSVYNVGGSVQSLAQVGVELNQDGTLTFDESRLKSAYASNPEAVKQFFTDSQSGLSKKMHTLMEQLSGTSGSLLSSRLQSLDDLIAKNEDRLTDMQDQLDRQKEALYLKFYRMEAAIAKIQSVTSIISSLHSIDLYSANSDNSSSN